MYIKRFFDPISPRGKVLNREVVLNSPEAKDIEARAQANAKLEGKSIAVSATTIFFSLIQSGFLSELRVRPQVAVSNLPRVKQRFTRGLLENGAREGWLTETQDTITINSTDGPVVFNILRTEGRYCCHTGDYIGTNKGDGAEARAYIAKNFDGVASPNPEWPAGYEVLNCIECELA